MRTPLPVARLRPVAKYASLPALLILSACSSGPSSDDIKSAFQQSLIAAIGSDMAPVVESITDVECREASDKPGYNCTFQATTFAKKINERNTSAVSRRFVQQGSQWGLFFDR